MVFLIKSFEKKYLDQNTKISIFKNFEFASFFRVESKVFHLAETANKMSLEANHKAQYCIECLRL